MKSINNKIRHAFLSVAVASAVLPATSAMAMETGAFADISYNTSDLTGTSDSFALGGLDFYARQDIDPKTTAFFEYVFENNGDSFVLDVERLYLKRKINDALNIGMGRIHSPLGYWNNTFHHGVLLQDTVSRPAFLDFEDGDAALLPTHGVGVTFDGDLDNGLSYDLDIVNSTLLDTSAAVGEREILIANVEDFSDDKTIIARLAYDFGKSTGLPLKLGVFGESNSIVESAATSPLLTGVVQGDEIIKQTVMGLDLRYQRGPFSLLTEYFSISDKASKQAVTGGAASGTMDNTAYYVQLGYQATEKTRVTYRYENVSLESNDWYYRTFFDRHEGNQNVLAIRYDLDDTNALTFEYHDITDDTDSSLDRKEMMLDWAFLLY